ncbi:MAG: response regulator transcription factor [Chloroflexota bacterium]
MATILFIHKDSSIREIVKYATEQDSHTLVHTDAVERLTRVTYKDSPDLIILDSSVVHHDSLNACRQLRRLPFLETTPILVLTEGKSGQEIAQVLDAGGDDCVQHTIVDRELAARIRALLRRKSRMAYQAQLTLNKRHKTVHLYEQPIDVTPTEYDLLDALCHQPGQNISAAELLDTVWHYPTGKGDPALVRNHIRNLRRKLEKDPNHPHILVCFQGRGYSISAEVHKS